MKIKVNGLTVNIISSLFEVPKNKTPIIFLHGFTGAANDWGFAMENIDDQYFPIAIDLPGHGKTEVSDMINDYTIDSISMIISTIIEKLQISKVVLLGYSMGGRAALSFAVQHPSRIKALILESTTAGIENADERNERLLSDAELAEKIENIGVDAFIKYWMGLPLFESQKSITQEEYQIIVKKKLNNNKKGLANSLRGFGVGKMVNLWNKLDNLGFPTLLITGSLDKKFEKTASKMKNRFPHSSHIIAGDAGHNVHLENPREFIKLVNNFLEKL